MTKNSFFEMLYELLPEARANVLAKESTWGKGEPYGELGFLVWEDDVFPIILNKVKSSDKNRGAELEKLFFIIEQAATSEDPGLSNLVEVGVGGSIAQHIEDITHWAGPKTLELAKTYGRQNFAPKSRYD